MPTRVFSILNTFEEDINGKRNQGRKTECDYLVPLGLLDV
jgi:hypothetical protein